MAIPYYLAMTAEEIAASPVLPGNIGWMACHFSPYATGLTNLPEDLPEGSLLILNDRVPIHGHDPKLIARELAETMERFSCRGLLLDFQNPGCGETAHFFEYLTAHAQYPVGVTEAYAKEASILFLPMIPATVPVREYLLPYAGQEIWLEISPAGQTIELTAEGTRFSDEWIVPALPGFSDDELHCHYHIEEQEDRFLFHVWRSADDLKALMEEAEGCGVKLCVGLYQELQRSIED